MKKQATSVWSPDLKATFVKYFLPIWWNSRDTPLSSNFSVEVVYSNNLGVKRLNVTVELHIADVVARG